MVAWSQHWVLAAPVVPEPDVLEPEVPELDCAAATPMPASNAAAERMERRESFMVVSSWVLIGAVRRPSLTETRHDRSECLGANGDSALHQSHHTTARTRLACCVHQPNSLRLRTTDRNTQKLVGTRCHCLLRIVSEAESGQSSKNPKFWAFPTPVNTQMRVAFALDRFKPGQLNLIPHAIRHIFAGERDGARELAARRCELG